jgi:hypothetical protein
VREQTDERDSEPKASADDEVRGRRGSSLGESATVVQFQQSDQLWQDLDEFQETLKTDLQFSNVAIGSVETIVSGFTVGYVLWAVRSGLLLSSVLASLPAWTMFDPLVIVSGGGPGDEEEEESLEDIVENQTALAAAQLRQESNTGT